MMPILVKSDDVRRGRKAKVRHGRSRAVMGGTGVSGLNNITLERNIEYNTYLASKFHGKRIQRYL